MGVSISDDEMTKMLGGYTEEVFRLIGGSVTTSLAGVTWGYQTNGDYDVTVSCYLAGLAGALVRFRIQPMPHCRRFGMSTEMMVHTLFRRKGLATLMQPLKAKIANWLGYTDLFCTCVLGNTAQVAVLERAGWKMLMDRRSDGDAGIGLWTKSV